MPAPIFQPMSAAPMDPFSQVKSFISMRDSLAPMTGAPQAAVDPSAAFGDATAAALGSSAPTGHTGALNSKWGSLSNEQRVSALMRAISQGESGGNYTARNPHGSASGAYQFVDQTWNGYGGKQHAYEADAATQDAYAHQLISRYLAQYGSPQAVVNAWYGGPKYANAGGGAYPGGPNGGLTLGANWDRKLALLNTILAGM